MNTWLFLIPIISTLLCWLFFKMMIWFIFNPISTRRFFRISIQGFLPRKIENLVDIFKVTNQVTSELNKYLEEKFTNPENIEQLMPQLEEHIDVFLREKLPKKIPVISMLIGERTTNELKTIFLEELKELFPHVMKSYLHQFNQTEFLKELFEQVIDKIKMESIVSSAKKNIASEISTLEVITALFGFLLGIIEVGLFWHC